MDITIKQLPKLISIIDVLRKGEISIAELSKKVEMKRSTLNYYLNILEKEGLIERNRIQKKKTGRPTLIKFNEERYKEEREKLEKKFSEDELNMLNHPLTFKLLKYLKINNNPSLKKVRENVGDSFVVSNHLVWLMGKGLIINEYKITDEGEKFLKENEKKTDEELFIKRVI